MLPIVYRKILFIYTYNHLKETDIENLRVLETQDDFLNIKGFLTIQLDEFLISKFSLFSNF